MKNLIALSYEGNEVRTVIINNEPWWVLKDVCEVLELSNSRMVADRLDDDEVCKFNLPHPQSPEKTLEMQAVNESGLYAVILRSDKPQAKPFRKWVTSEVLPSIRQTGYYSLKYQIPQTFSEALKLAAAQQEKIEQLKLENQSLEPKAAYFDKLVCRNLLTNLRDTAKEFEVGQKDFIDWLLKRKYLFRDQSGTLKPYLQHINSGLFKVKEWQSDRKAGIQTLITPRGRETFRLLLDL